MLKDRKLSKKSEEELIQKYFKNRTKSKNIGCKNNNARGITLIALVVTIVVLLILAGVSISAITGNESIMGKAKEAKEKNEISVEKDIIGLAIVEATSKNLSGDFTKEDLQEKLDSYSQNNNTIKAFTHGDDYAVYFSSSNRYYKVNSNGKIDQIEVTKDSTPANIKLGKDGENLDGLSKETAYEIWCIEDLLEWSKNYNTYKNSYIKLGQDLDFKSELSYADAQSTSYGDINNDGTPEALINEMQNGIGFTPISTYSGVFNGQDKEIKNIYIKSELVHVGFISLLSGGTVENFEISGQILQTSAYGGNGSCAGIVGNGNSTSTIKLCTNNANITSTSFAGGVVGIFSGKIDSCVNKANCTSSFSTGGMCGGGNATIINSYNTGNIESSLDAAGILAGNYRSGGAKIYNCYNSGKITGTQNTIYSTPGGIFGYMANAISSLNIGNCYNVGEIHSTLGWKGWSGGIIAIIRVITPTVTNCFYIDSGPDQSSIATPYSAEQMQSTNFIDELNTYITNNPDGIDTTGWAKWVQGSNGYPTFDFSTTWDGSNWVKN